MKKQIVLTEDQLEKVLSNTGISKKHFMAKLSNIKMEEFKERQQQRENG